MNRRESAAARHERLLEVGDYLALIRTLEELPVRSARQSTLLALALLRSGQFERARGPFGDGMLGGDPEAQVEYGNLLRALGQPQAARAHLEALLPGLDGELALRAQRWLGLCEDLLGLPGGLLRVQGALSGYLRLGDRTTAARIGQLLAAMHASRGHVREALRLLSDALPTLEEHANVTPYLTALCTLADLQLESQLYGEADGTLLRATELARESGNPYNLARLGYARAYLQLLRGDRGEFLRALQGTLALARGSGDVAVLEKGLCLLADHHSRLGEHSQALSVMLELYALNAAPTPGVRLAEALLARRRGDVMGSYRAFHALWQAATDGPDPVMAARAQLQMLYSLYLARDLAQVRELLPGALTDLARFGTPGGPLDLRADFDELGELFAFADLEPNSAPILASLLARGAETLGGGPDLLAPTAQLELLVLGQQTVVKDGVPLHFRLKACTGVLLYLALYPGRTRREIQNDLFPDKPPKVGGGYVNSAFSEIGQVLGPVVLQDGPHNAPTYRLSPKLHVGSDFQLLLTRLAEGNLPGAASVYRGELLPGFEDSEWLGELRSEVARSVHATLEGLLGEAQAAGDHARVMLLCTQGLKFDPLAMELATLRLEAARRGGTVSEVRRSRLELERLEHRMN